MLGKLFSKKDNKQISKDTSKEQTDQASVQPAQGIGTTSSNTIQRTETEQLIIDTLTGYESTNFPKGIMAVCQQFFINKVSDKTSPITVELTMPFPCQGELDELAETLSSTLNQTVNFDIAINVKSVRQVISNSSADNIANVIAVASGKGGVGKSTTTVNLAYALMAEGARVGILDADIYGPSIPTMLGIADKRPTASNGRLMEPLEVNGLSAMSIGFLVKANDATIWRGPMASNAFNQLFTETSWPELDYLLIDMPPGTGDIQLTLSQKLPVAAAVVVTTPQDIALVDAIKGIAMFDTVKVPVLGIVENMSYHLCENCGHHSHIFGENGGKDMAETQNIQLLGQLPLDIAIRQDADLGESEVFENSAGEIAKHYRKIARNIAAQLFLQCDNDSPLTANVVTTAQTK